MPCARISGERIRAAAICLACLIVTGCANLWRGAEPPTLAGRDQVVLRNALECWNLRAKIGIQTSTNAESARVDWQQDGTQYQIILAGPLGVGAVRIDGNAERVVMQTERNRMLVARNPEMLVREEFGWLLPVSNLYYWVRGIPVPDQVIEAQQHDQAGQRVMIEQAGWRVEYLQFMESRDLLLPAKIALIHPEIRIKLVIKSWDLNACH